MTVAEFDLLEAMHPDSFAWSTPADVVAACRDAEEAGYTGAGGVALTCVIQVELDAVAEVSEVSAECSIDEDGLSSILLRCEELSRARLEGANTTLAAHLASLRVADDEAFCLCGGLEYLRDQAEVLFPRAAVVQSVEVSAAQDGPWVSQWIYFIGFYTKSIVQDFCATAAANNLSGFLMPGKPGISCLEGTPKDVAAFIKAVRMVVFATVPASMRKMNIILTEQHTCGPRRFTGFSETPFKSASGHKRSDMADMTALRAFLLEHSVPQALFRQITMDI
jgi:hypothetical protein